jgi:hypothetical protein
MKSHQLANAHTAAAHDHRYERHVRGHENRCLGIGNGGPCSDRMRLFVR